MLDVIDIQSDKAGVQALGVLSGIENPSDPDGDLVSDHLNEMQLGVTTVPAELLSLVGKTNMLGDLREAVRVSCTGKNEVPRHPFLRALGIRQPKKVCGGAMSPEDFMSRLGAIVAPPTSVVHADIRPYVKPNNLPVLRTVR